MADDSSVVISFEASTDDAVGKIAQIKESLAGLGGQAGSIGDSFGRLRDACAAAFGDLSSGSKLASGQLKIINEEIYGLQQGLARQRILASAEVSQFKITQDQKYALLQAETEREFQAQRTLLRNELTIAGLNLRQRENIALQISKLEERHQTDMLRLDERSIAAQQALWTGYLSTVTGAFNSQLRGLLEGTTTWHAATVKMLEDLTIKFIEGAEQMMVKWVASEIAQTTATQSGAAAQLAARETAADAGILAGAASAVRAIMSDAAQVFAGVFAFLAPAMGPAAAGPAAAAQASVAAAAVFDVGTDYVVRGGLALIHPGETIIPAARGSGPFTGSALGAQVHAPVNIHVSALDSQSVARFFNDNSRHMMRAINDAVKRGAHLGMRSARP